MRFYENLRRLFHRKDEKYVDSENTKELISDPQPVSSYDKDFMRLEQRGEGYYFTNTVPYCADRAFKPETVETVLAFAYKMTFGKEGAHRDHRSGGTHERKNGEIFSNTFQGKLAECAACNYLHSIGFDATPDFETYQLGKWDSSDLSVGGKEISIKSTKRFGELLLLETHDWDEDAVYIPNKELDGGVYDIVIFVRLDPSCEDILRNARLIYSVTADYDQLKSLLLSKKWYYNCVGFVTREDLQYIIRNKFIIPQSAFINGKKPMDAENYYIQTGDMRKMESLKDFLCD